MAYRDFTDLKPFEELQLTENENNFINFVNGLKATGGGDGPEDVLGALNRSVEGQPWSGKAKV